MYLYLRRITWLTLLALKRTFVLLLLSIHLFNTGGYSLFFQYFIHQSEDQMIKQIYENKIDATKLVQIKLPVHTPMTADWPDYEHVQGQIEFKDVYYNYVGVKMTRDTMYLVCIANSTKTHLENANLIVAKNISDVPLTKKGQAQTVKKASVNFDYSNPAVRYSFLTYSQQVKKHESPIFSLLADPYIESPGKPPNFSA